MNGNSHDLERTTGDFILFALGFLGFVIGAAGLITSSIPGCAVGFGLLMLSVVSFMFKGQ
jgi:hypothetical protein